MIVQLNASVRLTLLVAMCWLTHVSWVRADMIFTLEQVAPGPISIGQTAEFLVRVRAEPAITNLDGIDFVVSANDPGLAGDVTSGGQFISGSNEIFTVGNYTLPFPTSTILFVGSGTDVDIGSSQPGIVLARFVLDTSGAVAGTYAMTLSNVAGVADDFSGIDVLISNPGGILSYTIVPVPEPNMIGYGILAAIPLIGRRMRARRSS